MSTDIAQVGMFKARTIFKPVAEYPVETGMGK